LVSVIVPNYNYGRYLERAIESLALQTHPAIEVWLVDDGSSDNSRSAIARVAERFRARFDAVETILRNENAGKLACLNAALERTRGEFVLVLDADDLLAPRFLEESLRALSAHRRWNPAVAFIYTNCRLIDSLGHVLGAGRSLPWDRSLLERSSYIPGCALTLAAPLRAAAPFDESIRVGTKHHVYLRLCAAGWEGRHLPRQLFSYRLHSSNLSGIGRRLLPNAEAGANIDPFLGDYWPTATGQVARPTQGRAPE
jgi:glycosyltransferase involved in cell wall biosynthesis